MNHLLKLADNFDINTLNNMQEQVIYLAMELISPAGFASIPAIIDALHGVMSAADVYRILRQAARNGFARLYDDIDSNGNLHPKVYINKNKWESYVGFDEGEPTVIL